MTRYLSSSRCAVYLLLTLSLVTGCAGMQHPVKDASAEMPEAMPAAEPAPMPEPMPAPVTAAPVPDHQVRGQVSHHEYGPILAWGMERQEYQGFAVYTYVLFNSDHPDAGSREGQRYDSLLRAVLEDVKTEKQGSAAGWQRNETNIFCIPFVTRVPKKDDALGKYDFELAGRYLGVLQESVKKNKKLFDRLQYRSGPFLVSLYEPLPNLQGKAATKMLYVDLTDMSPGAMREVLDAYRKRLDAGPLGNQELLKNSIKVVMLKYILWADENINIVETAFAKFK